MDSGGGAFGAGKAGGQFDPVVYIKKPQVIARLLSLLFSIIVFGCISSKGWDRETDKCLYNGNANACNYGVTIGVLAFLGLIAFLLLDAVFETRISSIQHRKYIVMADIGFSGLWTFLWFVGFCFLADQWRKAETREDYGKSAVEAAIAFSFFSILSFGVTTFLAVQRYRLGITEDFSQTGAYGDPNLGPAGGMPPQSSPYGAYAGGNAGETGDPYQQPFGGGGGGGLGGQEKPKDDFAPPTY